MATESTTRCVTMKAAGDLSGKQFYAMKISAADTVTTCTAAGEAVIGVLQNKPDAANRAATIAFDGITKAIAGGSVTAGNRVKTDSSGTFVAATAATVDTSDGGAASDAVVGSNVFGIAITGASTNEIFSVLITREGAIPTTAA